MLITKLDQSLCVTCVTLNLKIAASKVKKLALFMWVNISLRTSLTTLMTSFINAVCWDVVSFKRLGSKI